MLVLVGVVELLFGVVLLMCYDSYFPELLHEAARVNKQFLRTFCNLLLLPDYSLPCRSKLSRSFLTASREPGRSSEGGQRVSEQF